jgi:protocatechuate 3,4-dioxygenase alpha subunit
VKGERVWLACRVLDGEGQPVTDAMVEVWQADSEGRYRAMGDASDGVEDGFRGFGRLGTDEDGKCEFETIRPGRVPGPKGVLQAPHIVVAVFARGMLKQLFTRIYFGDDQANKEDEVLALVTHDRRDTLLAHRNPAQQDHWRFDIHLQGEQETVFFDV